MISATNELSGSVWVAADIRDYLEKKSRVLISSECSLGRRGDMIYSHTQSGWRILTLVGLMTLGVGLATTYSPGAAGRSNFYVLLGIFLLTSIMFHSLTVEVGPNTVSLWFGPGFPRKTIRISDIQDCRSVRNPWYYGWGIHRTSRGWLYNISGPDAVELDLKTGKRIRIGTDEPDVLCSAIRTAIRMSIGR